MIQVWERSLALVKNCPQAEAHDTYVTLHIHAVRPVVGSRYVAEVRIVEVSRGPPEPSLHLTAHASTSRASIVTPQRQAVKIRTRVGRRVVLVEGVVLLIQLVDGFLPLRGLIRPVGAM